MHNLRYALLCGAANAGRRPSLANGGARAAANTAANAAANRGARSPAQWPFSAKVRHALLVL
jgi:hypothetical protein